MMLTVIFTTYNAPAWLEKTLWGFHFQRHRDFEIIIADDGSTQETADTIQRMREATGMTIRHVWHEDNGFRKCEILNKAILHARYDYLVFTDGDCIPRSDFLDQHIARARPGLFLTGSAIRLPMSTSETISIDDIQTGRCFKWDWLRENGLPITQRNLKIRVSPAWARFLNRLPTARANFMGCNASAWKQDVIAVNGFDHRFQWGGLDRELGVRLKNNGIRAERVRFSAHVLHLDHKRGYADKSIAATNRARRRHNEKNNIAQTDFGINLLLAQGYKPAN